MSEAFFFYKKNTVFPWAWKKNHSLYNFFTHFVIVFIILLFNIFSAGGCMVSRLSVHLSVHCLSVFILSERSRIKFFLVLSMWFSNWQKPDRARFFRKILIWPYLDKRDQIQLKKRVYLNFWQKLSFDFIENGQSWNLSFLILSLFVF